MVIIVKVRLMSLAEIAQLVEHFTRNEGVEGSSPFFSFLKSLGFQGFFHFLHSESRPLCQLVGTGGSYFFPWLPRCMAADKWHTAAGREGNGY